MNEGNFWGCAKFHALDWLFFLGYVPFLKLHLVLKLSNFQSCNDIARRNKICSSHLMDNTGSQGPTKTPLSWKRESTWLPWSFE